MSANTVRSRLARALGLVLSLLAACGDQVEIDNGLESKLRVTNGQFENKAYPVDTTAAPALPAPVVGDAGVVSPPDVLMIDSQNNSVKRGAVGKGVRVVAGQGASTVAVGLEGDHGYWIVPVATRSVEFELGLELTATLEFDRSLPVGPARLWFVAVNPSGQYGAPKSLDLMILDDAPNAPLVVSLDWTQNVDLDLLVVRPDGTVLTNKATRSASEGPDAPKIDLDSNANCVLDGHRVENALFTAVPDGQYSVFVRLASACGFAETGWRVRLLRDGQEISRVNGAAYAYETTLPNGGPAGTGRLALQFNIGG